MSAVSQGLAPNFFRAPIKGRAQYYRDYWAALREYGPDPEREQVRTWLGGQDAEDLEVEQIETRLSGLADPRTGRADVEFGELDYDPDFTDFDTYD